MDPGHTNIVPPTAPEGADNVPVAGVLDAHSHPRPRPTVLNAQIDPVNSLFYNESYLPTNAAHTIGLYIEHDRCGLPVLRAPGMDSNYEKFVVVANTAGQLINSPIYFDTSEEARQTRRNHEEATLSHMLGFSKPNDIFVASSTDPTRMTKILSTIRESYSRARIGVSSNFTFVSELSEVAQSSLATLPLIPAILTPEVFELCPLDHSLRPVANGITISNIAAYTKNGAEIWWNRKGLPTPRTEYIDLSHISHQAAVECMKLSFPDYDQVVINTTGGSGGYAIHCIKLSELTADALQSRFNTQVIQIQGLLDVKMSPCVIASIDDHSSQILGVSIQKFHSFGIHSGNYWNREIRNRLERDYPGMETVAQDALSWLRQCGVRGQVNIDLLCLSPEECTHRGFSSRSVLREANIRPAGSSVFLRLREGLIDGESVEHIASVTGVGIDLSTCGLASVLSTLERCRTPGRTRAVLYSVNPIASTCGIAFLGTHDTSLSELLDFERAVLARR